MNNKIDTFRGENYFLSNFYNANVTYKGETYPNNECAFQAQKTKDTSIKRIFTKLTPQEAKKLGRNIRLRRDWNYIKDDIMYEICYAKFEQNKILQKKLFDTGSKQLIEGNSWHDTYWGMCNNHGENRLGKILMKVRRELKKEANI